MSRFYVPPESIKGDEVIISGKEAHHILDVMRLKRLDKVVIFDGTGTECDGIIKETGPGASLSVTIVRIRRPSAPTASQITLIQSIPKKERMDYIVEKATELGVSRIIPVVTARTIPRWSQFKRSIHADRWAKIAMAAAKQCGRADVPAVEGITGFRDCVKGSTGYGTALIAALSDEAVSLKDALRDRKDAEAVAVAVGPEGDFTPEEIGAARTAGFKLISLGKLVLKSDTAAIYALSILNYELSNR